MKKDIFLSILSGLLLILSFPNFNLWMFAWFAFVPLLLALEGCSKRRVFLLSYLTGAVFWLGTIYWLVHVTLAGMILLVLYLALYFGIFGLIASQSRKLNTAYCVFFLPAVWVLLEYLRSHLLTGFGWALLGHSQYLNLPVIQVADITGAYGISFILLMANAGIKEVIVLLRQSGKRRESAAAILLCLAMLGAFFFYGYYRLNIIKQRSVYASLRVSVIQGNIAQHLKWRPIAQNYIIRKYLDLSSQAGGGNPDVMIWPEASLPAVVEEEPAYFEAARALAEDMRIPLLVGAVTLRDGIYYNSAFLITSYQQEFSRYDKLHLVPFGEYVPLKSFFSFLETVVPIGDFRPGREYTVFTLPGVRGQGPVRFSVLICFEDLFPQLSRRFIGKGADFLVNITNDGWFGESAAPYQHLSASVLRAVENRVPLVRAANTGVSGFISAEGRIISLVADNRGENIFIEGYLNDTIDILRGGPTFYTRFGDLAVLGCFLLAFYGMARILRESR
ncbi:MAG: apolipoprotein N-acyltransferase [Candidatus Paceibacterota bacterium]|jgi:apolipoprotein N-acyltransferase